MQEEENPTGVSRIEGASVSAKRLLVSAGSVCTQTKEKARQQLQPRMEFPACGLGEHPNPDHAELKVS